GTMAARRGCISTAPFRLSAPSMPRCTSCAASGWNGRCANASRAFLFLRAFLLLGGLLLRPLGARGAVFRQADGDGLFAAGDGLARTAALQRAGLALLHHLFDLLRGGFGV